MSSTPLTVDLGATDYNKTHHFAITVDPDNATLERDETNNVLRITVPVADRPLTAYDPPCTSP